jgi:formylglycine-generating enzyme required for sulfatase activity
MLHGCRSTPEEYTETIPGTTVSFRMVPVTGGGAHQPFWIAATEVTWDQFDLFVYGAEQDGFPAADAVTRPSKPYLPPDRGFGHAGYPAMSMSLHSAQEFCRWLSLKTGRLYQLPTTQQWRLACSAGEPALGGEWLDGHAWHANNSEGTTHPVGKKPPGALGIHDMLGNVAEWCADPDGSAVVCGGSYLDDPETLAPDRAQKPSASWNASDPQLPKSRWWLADCSFVGFRVVCVDVASQRPAGTGKEHP